MFRQSAIIAALLGASLSATAASVADAPVTADDTAATTSGLDPQAYVQSQLDWRSYYLDRVEGSRVGLHVESAPATDLPVSNGS